MGRTLVSNQALVRLMKLYQQLQIKGVLTTVRIKCFYIYTFFYYVRILQLFPPAQIINISNQLAMWESDLKRKRDEKNTILKPMKMYL